MDLRVGFFMVSFRVNGSKSSFHLLNFLEETGSNNNLFLTQDTEHLRQPHEYLPISPIYLGLYMI